MSAQKSGRLIQSFGAFFPIASQQTEKHLGVSVVRRYFHRLNGDHAYSGVFQFARDQLGQIALDLVGYLETAVGAV
jgi:hypothetical protein